MAKGKASKKTDYLGAPRAPKAPFYPPAPDHVDTRIEALVEDLIGCVADKWTMIVLEALSANGKLRFTEIGKLVAGISQKMLTQTLRQMERDGLLSRKVYPVVPPKVEYTITDLGRTLSGAFCGVWIWASDNLDEVENARAKFDKAAQKTLS